MSNSPAPKPSAGSTGPAAAKGSTGPAAAKGTGPQAGQPSAGRTAPLAGQAGAGGMTRAGRTRRGMWDLGAGDAEMVLAEARKALFVMVAFLAAIWIVQIANWADHYQLSIEYGIRPHDLASLPDILSAPFLHFSWAHIEGNSGPLFIFGFLAAYRGVAKFAGVTVLVILASGLAAWLTESSGSVGAGASGVVFGYFGYIMVRGLFDRHAIDILLGAVMALCFAYQFSVLLPQAGIGWQAHIGGVAGGIAAVWFFRDRRPGRRP
jgi:membrane associated rhomboid family serine protease